VVVVLADGDDNWSGIGAQRDAVISKADRRDIPVFAIAFGDADTDNLRYISQETGGVFAHSEDAEGLAGVFESIGFGIFQGRIVVTGTGTFAESLAAGDYTVTGTLQTTLEGTTVDTPFSFKVTVE